MELDINDIRGDIKEYCIACLDKSLNMYNLNENVQKRELFTSLFNIELTMYMECPQFICSICSIKLDVAYNFKHSVAKSLDLLEQYNNRKKSENINLENSIQEVNIVDEFASETETVAEITKRNCRSKVEVVSLDLVNKVIKDFKNKLAEKKVCVICGFIAANRRSISSHMAILHKEEKNNWCLECNEVFENYKEHKNTYSKRYQCPFCPKETNLSHYIEHIQSHAGVFKCDICHKNFKSAAWVEKHKRIHTNDKPYICPNCSKSFIQPSSLRYHVGTHGKFPCALCKKRYKTEKDLQDHECAAEIWIKIEELNENSTEKQEISIIESTVYDSTEFQNFCKYCDKRVKSLSQHINKCHTIAVSEEANVVNEVKCEFCQKSYSSPYALKIHLRKHTGELPYKCRYCDKKVLNRFRLNDHERTHTKEKPFICNVCGKSLSRSSALRTHMRQHTGRPEACHLCTKRFCRKSELRLHLSKHKGEKPFLCTICGRAFAQKSHLTEHMVGHSEARPFQCRYCQKAFKKSVILKEHEKLHGENKPHKCSLCSYACYQPYRLQQHMKQHSTNPSVTPLGK